jgi:hypothetical protein
MAIIENQSPPPAPLLSPDFKRRIVIKFRADTQLPYIRGAESELVKQEGHEWRELTAKFPGLTLSPYFSTIEESTLSKLTQQVPRVEGTPTSPNFALYYAIESPSGVEPEQIAKIIAKWANVETAYVEAGPVPPPLFPADDPRNSNQGYQNAAPTGINARWAWAKTDGTDVGFVDLEQGWTLNHEDLVAANITIISGVNQAYQGHGSAVLGEVIAVDNTLGGIGIAPKANTRVVSQWRTTSTYNTAEEAILSAVGVMSYGDVLLLEAQTSYSTAAGYVPVETEQAVFDAIQYATSQGIVVIEAGANGSVDLDAFQDTSGKYILNRNSSDFRDSGAIIVGAASSTSPHQRLGFSNYGSRIDCFAWGQNIDTCGDGWTGNATNTYISNFGGTSGATPIVVGAALLLQSWRIGQSKPRYSPYKLRQLLSDASLNTQSAAPGTDRIGVMPNLRFIFEKEGLIWWLPWIIYLTWAWLIIIGGLLITPGGTFCIKCGPLDIGYIGDTVINVLGTGAMVLGIIGLLTRQGLAARN